MVLAFGVFFLESTVPFFVGRYVGSWQHGHMHGAGVLTRSVSVFNTILKSALRGNDTTRKCRRHVAYIMPMWILMTP